jgi:hypothetical protein
MTSVDKSVFTGKGRCSHREHRGQLLVQFGHEVSGTVSLDIQDISIQSQDIADQDVKVTILLESHGLRITHFVNEVGPSLLTHSVDVVHQQAVSLCTMAYAAVQPLKAFCQFREGLPKSEVNRAAADHQIKDSKVDCGCIHSIFHVNLTFILRQVVKGDNDNLVDTNLTRRDHQYVMGGTIYE